jgi:hypothetical protein
MKKLIPLFLVVGLLACAVPALAGNGDVEWAAKKTIFLTETFSYTETATFKGTGLFLFDGEAWAKIQEQQELFNLHLNYGPGPETKTAQIATGAYNNATGIANVNQAPGNLVNQGNEVAFSSGNKGTDAPAETNTFEGMFCEAQVVAVQYNGILFEPAPPGVPGGNRTGAANNLVTGNKASNDIINGAFNVFAGIANVNQSAGDMNNQGNAVAIAGGVNEVVVKAASDIQLAQNTAFNTMHEGVDFAKGNTTQDAVNNSFGSFFGVADVNQAAGSMNNQKNAVTISFAGFAK